VARRTGRRGRSGPGDASVRWPARLARVLGITTALLLALGAVWLLTTALLARSEIAAAESELGSIRAAISSGELAATRAQAGQLSRHTRRAHLLTTGPAWWLAERIPVLGTPVKSVRGCAAAADQLSATVLTPLSGLAGSLRLSSVLDRGQLDLSPIIEAGWAIATADRNFRSGRDSVDSLPNKTWLHSVDERRSQFSETLMGLQAQLDKINTVASVLPPMLGSEGTRRYFVGLENEAESRGLGGVPGAFAIVTAQNGKLSFGQFSNDVALYHARTTLDLGSEYYHRYQLADPTNTYTNSTISPDFADAAQIWAAMWSAKTGQHLDGAIAIDPTAVSYLLEATGPAVTNDGTSITASNVVALTQQTLYRTHLGTAGRKAYLLEIASAISRQLVSAPGSERLLQAATRAVTERRMVVWSAAASIEKTLRSAGASGTLEPANRPFAGFTTVNAVGGKLDYYLHRSMSYVRSGCAPETTTIATFTLTSKVPAGTLPTYVTVRQDDPGYPTRPGDDKVLVSYYATLGSQISSVTIDGRPIIVATTTEKGLTVFTVPLEIARDASHTIRVTLHEPIRSGTVQLLRQPAVHPISVSVEEPSCG
jgi:hypothetical protein